MTKAKQKKPLPDFEYPGLHRSADDYAAALSAFHRLYLYGLKEKNPVISILAVFKALQKLEQEYGYDTGHVVSGELAPCPLPAPQWLREGVWLVLETFLAKPMLPDIAGKSRPQTFSQVMAKHLRDYQYWSAMFLAADAEGGEGIKKLLDQGNSERTIRRAYNRIQAMIAAANEFQCTDANGHVLAYVEPRDLVPTGRLAKVYQASF